MKTKIVLLSILLALGFTAFGQWNPTSATANDPIGRSGNVGVGTASPITKLHVSKGNLGVSPHSAQTLLVEDNNHAMISIVTPSNKIGYYGFADTDDNFVAGMQYNHYANKMTFRVNNHSTDMVISSNGNVGIKNTSPQNELDVCGTIRGSEVKVEEGWCDFVFAKDYQLPTLKEEAQHIQEKGHLSGFDSAEEMNGEIKLGDVTKKQQLKIEEMMLHIIQLSDRLEKLEVENAQLKKAKK